VKNVKLSPANIVILAAGAVMLIASFLGFYKLDIPVEHLGGGVTVGGSTSYNAWSSGQFLIATLPAFIGMAMAGQIALVAFGGVSPPEKPLGLTWDQIHLVLGFQAALMMLAFLIRSKPTNSFGIGFWLMLLSGIALFVGAVMRTSEAGRKPRAV